MASLKFKLFLPLFILSTAAQAQPSPAPLPSTLPLPLHSLPPPPPASVVDDAVETLANSGYVGMSLALQFIAQNQILPLPLPLPSAAVTSLTIFSPSDASFVSGGQPSLAHLLLHFSPVSLSPAALLSFPFSTPIPSLSPSKHLIVTTNQSHQISINNVGISDVPLLDDGFILVYAADGFFDLDFTLTLSNPTRTSPKPHFFQCAKLQDSLSRFSEAAGVLKSRGHSIIASFLELQLLGFLDDRSEDNWTVFAPADQDLVEFSGDFLEYSSLFTRHVVPCKVGWVDLEETDNPNNAAAAIFNLKGFALNITRDGEQEMLMVNGVEITFPDMFETERIVIHGIRGVIPLPELDDEEELVEETQSL